MLIPLPTVPPTIDLDQLEMRLPNELSLLHEPDYLGLSFKEYDLEGVLDGFLEARTIEPRQLWVTQATVVTKTVLDYASQIQAGKDVEPPLVVVLEDGQLIVWDGHHRLVAYMLLAFQAVEVWVFHHAS